MSCRAMIVPVPRYDGVRRLSDMVIDEVFGEPLRRLQRWFKSRRHRWIQRTQRANTRRRAIVGHLDRWQSQMLDSWGSTSTSGINTFEDLLIHYQINQFTSPFNFRNR